MAVTFLPGQEEFGNPIYVLAARTGEVEGQLGEPEAGAADRAPGICALKSGTWAATGIGSRRSRVF